MVCCDPREKVDRKTPTQEWAKPGNNAEDYKIDNGKEEENM